MDFWKTQQSNTRMITRAAGTAGYAKIKYGKMSEQQNHGEHQMNRTSRGKETLILISLKRLPTLLSEEKKVSHIESGRGKSLFGMCLIFQLSFLSCLFENCTDYILRI